MDGRRQAAADHSEATRPRRHARMHGLRAARQASLVSMLQGNMDPHLSQVKTRAAAQQTGQRAVSLAGHTEARHIPNKHLETSMSAPSVDPFVAHIRANPKYLALKRERNRFGWWLAALMMVVYYGYIALIAFNKPFLSQPIGNGVTTLGVPIGMGVIVFTVVITGIYVRRANTRFDELTRQILEESKA